METVPAVPGGGAVSAGGLRVCDVVRAVVAEVAPEELPVVEALAGLDDAVVVRRLRGRARRDPLGFGTGEVAALAAPVVWLAIDQAVRRIGEGAVDGVAKGLRAVLRRVLRRRSAPVVVPPLTREQLAEVRSLVLQTAVQRGLGDRRATAIADAVVARLALAEPGGNARGPADPDSPAGSGTRAQG